MKKNIIALDTPIKINVLIKLDPELPTALEYGVPYTEYTEKPNAEQQ